MAALTEANRIVVKIGSALLVERSSGALRQDWLASLAEDVAGFRAKGVDVVIVSSGSIALGRSVLGLGAAELTLEQSQAAAAVGQIQLARAYEQHLAPHGVIAAQVLVTLEDSADRRRYLNSRATLAEAVVWSTKIAPFFMPAKAPSAPSTTARRSSSLPTQQKIISAFWTASRGVAACAGCFESANSWHQAADLAVLRL